MAVHHIHPSGAEQIKHPRLIARLKWAAIALWAIAFVLALAPLL